MDYTRRYDSPLGGITMAGDGEALTGLWLDGQKHFASTLSAVRSDRNLPVFDETVRWLDIYFSGKDPGLTPKMRLRGTAFQHAVWQVLLTISYGRTMSYGQVAERLAGWTGVRRASAQAVGGAVGHSPVSLIVPCHRVIGADGSLTGYAGGIELKAKLLRMEGAVPNGGGRI